MSRPDADMPLLPQQITPEMLSLADRILADARYGPNDAALYLVRKYAEPISGRICPFRAMAPTRK